MDSDVCPSETDAPQRPLPAPRPLRGDVLFLRGIHLYVGDEGYLLSSSRGTRRKAKNCKFAYAPLDANVPSEGTHPKFVKQTREGACRRYNEKRTHKRVLGVPDENRKGLQ